jgi:hypothetical protein
LTTSDIIECPQGYERRVTWLRVRYTCYPSAEVASFHARASWELVQGLASAVNAMPPRIDNRRSALARYA